jgi:hypothetical protein
VIVDERQEWHAIYRAVLANLVVVERDPREQSQDDESNAQALAASAMRLAERAAAHADASIELMDKRYLAREKARSIRVAGEAVAEVRRIGRFRRVDGPVCNVVAIDGSSVTLREESASVDNTYKIDAVDLVYGLQVWHAQGWRAAGKEPEPEECAGPIEDGAAEAPSVQDGDVRSSLDRDHEGRSYDEQGR